MERFWSKVIKAGEDECWTWTGASSSAGYGRFKVNGKLESSHRISWELSNNSIIPNGYDICHLCDNPSCVNPKHLFLGTRSDNVIDSIVKGRFGHIKNNKNFGEFNGKSKLSKENVIEIKKLLSYGVTHAAIARRFGIHKSAVSKINLGKSWAHITD